MREHPKEQFKEQAEQMVVAVRRRDFMDAVIETDKLEELVCLINQMDKLVVTASIQE